MHKHLEQAAAIMMHMAAERKKGHREGQLPCPRCGGVVRWVCLGPRSARAKCETPSCIEMLS